MGGPARGSGADPASYGRRPHPFRTGAAFEPVAGRGHLERMTTDEQTLSANVCFFSSHSGHSHPM